MQNVTHALYDQATTEIDGVNYSINLLNTSESLITGQSILELVLPSAGAAADGMFGEKDFLSDEPSTFTSIAFHLVRQMKEFQTVETIKKLLANATADGVQIDFESHFRGKLSLLANLVEFSAKENFGSLFTDMGLKQRLTSYMENLIAQTREQQKEEELQTS